MPLQNHILSSYLAQVEALREAADPLAEPLARAAEIMVESLMSEGKILACGQGGSEVSARLFAALLCQQHQLERPGLAAIALDVGGLALAEGAEPAAMFARQIESLGHAGDVLLALSGNGNDLAVLAALRGAHEHGLRVVVLSGGDGGLLAEALGEDDVVICTGADSATLVRELQLRAIHSLCDGIDYLLLGA
jgi:D-sedoheptulose 7-phosphate isomerase